VAGVEKQGSAMREVDLVVAKMYRGRNRTLKTSARADSICKNLGGSNLTNTPYQLHLFLLTVLYE
jgi:hypothetical protein